VPLLAVGGDHRQAADPVGGEAERPGERPDATAQRHPDRGRRAGHRGQPVRQAGLDQAAAGDARAQGGGARVGVDDDGVQRRGPQQQGVPADRPPGAVAGGLDGEAQTLRGCVPDGGGHVGGVPGLDDERGLVHHGQVLAGHGRCTAGIAGAEHGAGEPVHGAGHEGRSPVLSARSR
jgi:hypothetical protein